MPGGEDDAHRSTLILESEVSHVICLNSAKDFQAVGQYYRDFRKVTDDEVIKLLKSA